MLRNNPESISNAMINELGNNYLHAHPQPTSSHNSHDFANAMADYNLDSDDKAKWYFLAEQYVGLVAGGKNGELAKSIRKLYHD